MMKKPIVTLIALLFFRVLSHACAVCFGDGNSSLNRGFFWGVIVLGALPFMMLGGFVSYLIYHTRKRKS
jgi:hypothetical protein